MKKKVTIAISIGDPAGVGPEVTFKALQSQALQGAANWIVVGDEVAFAGLTAVGEGEIRGMPGVNFRFLHKLRSRPKMGHCHAGCGGAALAYVREATEMCLRQEADAMVTAPLNKEAVRMIDASFTGHTDYIANLCGVTGAKMMLASRRMRVLHVTTHCSLRAACDISKRNILETIRLGNEALKTLGHRSRRIAVCGLNPHAGEHGAFGDEEKGQIEPAIAAARREGIECCGPMAADTVFIKAHRGEYDLVIAMYHDQGHIPMKLLAFESTVNVSLGLPIIRTSVDHGTAFDIAGKNRAASENMTEAMKLAITMAGGGARTGDKPR